MTTPELVCPSQPTVWPRVLGHARLWKMLFTAKINHVSCVFLPRDILLVLPQSRICGTNDTVWCPDLLSCSPWLCWCLFTCWLISIQLYLHLMATLSPDLYRLAVSCFLRTEKNKPRAIVIKWYSFWLYNRLSPMSRFGHSAVRRLMSLCRNIPWHIPVGVKGQWVAFTAYERSAGIHTTSCFSHVLTMFLCNKKKGSWHWWSLVFV